MRGLTLRITNVSPTSLTLTDLAGQPIVGAGEIRELLYTDEVQSSLEFGSINGFLTLGVLTAQFVSGTDLSQAPIGRTFTGASATTQGERGLVPTALSSQTGYFLKGDGTWTNVTSSSIGAIPEAKLTAQGDLLVRGTTTSERLPLGALGTALRTGLVTPEWQNVALADVFANRPLPSAYYSGILYWATDLNTLYVCYDNGVSYTWGTLFGSGANTGGWDTFPSGGTPTFTGDITHPGRAGVGVPTASSIETDIQFQVDGSTLTTRTFIRETTVAPDKTGATQLRAKSVDGGLYVKPEGLTERRADLPSLARKEVPDPEPVIIPGGGQYICHETFVLDGGATLTLEGDSDLVVFTGEDLPPGLSRKVIPSPEQVYVHGGWQYLCYDSLTVELGASLILEANADLVILFDSADQPGLTRKFIPGPETVTIPSGAQYLCYDSLTFGPSAFMVLQGDADLVILDGPPIIPELLNVLTSNGDMLYRNGVGDVDRIPVGANQDILTVQGGLPTWQTPPWTGVVPPATVQTTDATVTNLLSIPTTANKGHALDLMVSATLADRSDQVAWKVLSTVTRDGGGVVTVRDVLATASGPTPWTVNVTAVGLTIVVTVQGALATVIDWIAAGSVLV